MKIAKKLYFLVKILKCQFVHMSLKKKYFKYLFEISLAWFSITCNVTFSFISVIVDRFGHSLRFCHLEFEIEANSDNCRRGNAGIGGGFWILSKFRELSFCGPCGTCLFAIHICFIFKIKLHNFLCNFWNTKWNLSHYQHNRGTIIISRRKSERGGV